MDEILENLPAALRHLRYMRGYSQSEVAEKAGITKAMLSTYEQGRQVPALRTLAKVLNALSCSLIDLCEAIEHVRGRCILVVTPPASVPPHARPSFLNFVRSAVDLLTYSLGDTGAQTP